ncbi:uncharacterized protein LOC132607071 isoform X3 [Lycium barbarum]|uniref:uncharacterized protein LOC132607071 isoform X3 n=1 Tax=Lycium barbarum TaxID=112863 RepID=UPI00293E8F59|nr:uncharacterized protein LOC132607071 isoform X3 [Lycium barbarum]
MGDSSAQYIHLVHHLIEECLLFNMSREECMEALSKHANIQPVITSTGPIHQGYVDVQIVILEVEKVPECGRSWRRRTRSSLRLTRENTRRKDHQQVIIQNLKWR